MQCTERSVRRVFQKVNEEEDIEVDGCCEISTALLNTIGAQNSQMLVSGQTSGFKGNCDELDSGSSSNFRETTSASDEAKRLKDFKKKAERVHERKRKLLFTEKTENTQRRTETPPRYREYRTFEIRQKSFIGFKSNSIYPVEIFAKAGFFYKGFSDIVSCFQCGVIHKDWQLNEDPVQSHILLKNNCPYVTELRNEDIYTSNDIKRQNDREISDVTSATNKMSISTAVSTNQQLTLAKTPPDQRLLCKVCTLNQVEVTVEPCGHFAMCQACSRQLIRNNMSCPICRGPINNILRTYLD